MLSLETFKAYWDVQFPNVRLKRSHFLLAVSGGIDSVVLTHMMHSLRANCTIAHANFQLRGEESKRDENFVKTLGSQLGFPVKIHSFETLQYAQTYKIGIQEAAREMRYAWFESLMTEMANKTDGNRPIYLLTAHHANDQVETVLMQFCRGTGLHGLTGIPSFRNDILLLARPLLGFTRKQISSYAQLHALKFVEDSSNEKDDYTRNLFRHQIIPSLEKVFPQLDSNILRTVERLKEAESIVNHSIDDYWRKGLRVKKGILSVPISYWKKVIKNQTYTWGLIRKFDFKPTQIEEVLKILNASEGAYISSSTHRLLKWNEYIQIVENQSSTEYILIKEDDKVIESRHFKLHFEFISNTDIVIQSDSQFAYLDASKVKWPLLLRTWQSSDYFYPFGLKKKKKMGPFLGSLKMGPSVKASALVLTSGDKIMWVVGKRIDDRYKINSSTSKILLITSVEKL